MRRYLSVCSGIEAASVAWHPLGWEPVAFAEIETFPCALLTHHYPNVPNWGDMTKHKEWPDADVDVLVGGTPCQAFSVAGLRAGLADPRGNLTLTFLGIVEQYRPEWVVWENVPGVLSIDGGRTFGSFLGGLAELGYGFAYRVLDAQFFGVAQRRRRVFVVANATDWRRAAAVLFERESLSGNPAPRREAGENSAPAIAARTRGGGGLGTDFDCDGGLIAHSLRADGFDASEDGTGRGTPLVPVKWPADVASTLNAHYGDKWGLEDQHALNGAALFVPAVTGPITAGIGKGPRGTEAVDSDSDPMLQTGMAVRRLLPEECETLQGFPRGYTLVPYNKRPAKDGPRYKALGNSMAVPVMRWIGERIAMIANMTGAKGRAA